MQKVKNILVVGILALCALSFTTQSKNEVKWMSFAEMQEAYAKEPRPILIDMYTNWCGWCKVMDKNTYQHSKVAAYINEHYYAVKFDAESKEEISFNGKKYAYNPRYKTHDLAMELSFGRLEYPNTIFLADIKARPAPLAGYMKPKEIEAPLKYFAERSSEQESFVEFNKQLKKQW